MLKKLVILLLLLSHLASMADVTRRAQSVITKVNGNTVNLPVVNLASSDVLTVDFDIVEPDMTYLKASITPLHPDGRPLAITDDEFLNSFNRVDIDQCDYSQATVTPYNHYTFTLTGREADAQTVHYLSDAQTVRPYNFSDAQTVQFFSDAQTVRPYNLMPTKSGLFRLDFVDTDQPDDTLLTIPFYVAERQAGFDYSISPITDTSYHSGQRQLTLTADINRSITHLTPATLSLYVFIDGRLAAGPLSPTRLNANLALFDHHPSLIFNNGNIWRRFDTTDTYYPGHGVLLIQQTPDGNHRFMLEKDHPRATQNYPTDQTLYGRFIIGSHIGQPDTNADYCDVVFSLDLHFMPGSPVAVDGDFTRHLPGGVLPMSFDSFSGLYQAVIPLKQGVYNYRYLSGNPLRPDSIEGNFNETPQQFDLLLFYNSPTSRYPRLIGHQSITYQH